MAVAVSSASGLLSLLEEDDEALRLHALQALNKVVHEFWFQIAGSIASVEAFYEDEEFSHRELAALVASKVLVTIARGPERADASLTPRHLLHHTAIQQTTASLEFIPSVPHRRCFTISASLTRPSLMPWAPGNSSTSTRRPSMCRRSSVRPPPLSCVRATLPPDQLSSAMRSMEVDPSDSLLLLQLGASISTSSAA